MNSWNQEAAATPQSSTMDREEEEADLNPWRTEKPTIFRVPEIIREADPGAYEPNLISLGPYHRGVPRLQAMEKVKPQYLHSFLRRTNPPKSKDECRNYIKKEELRVRSAYSEVFKMDSDKFVDMMLHDGCFVVEFLLRLYDRKDAPTKRPGVIIDDDDVNDSIGNREYDPILASSWTEYFVRLDMLLLENQLPLFLIRDLLSFVDPARAANSLKPLALQFFGGDFLPGRTKKLPEKLEAPVRKSRHILHLLHACIHPPTESRPRTKSPTRKLDLSGEKGYFGGGEKGGPRRRASFLPSFKRNSCFDCCEQDQIEDAIFTPLTPSTIPCARELKDAGIEIKRKKQTDSFLDVTFRNGRLEIPRIRAYNVSNAILRNLIAFEQLYPDRGTHVTDFTFLIDCLIDTAADVAILREADILVSTMGSNKSVARLFNRLCLKVVVEPKNGHLWRVFEDIPKHCEKRANKWRATLNHIYFGNPWTGISVVAAIFLFILTMLQTVLAILSYVNPP
ncbi:UPF0481 protein At3g47200-like [Zingiber officinale]|uniref:Uncharacterized protein n=1 Tax=Zingiber officinale TaxID=94328 RepID=A0A8J5GAU4_ZINOF|nr:UPF0481 protein At3g47200-like [Zingiber officinale]KAG6504468.1 hypothetical protein ZIOFF_036801 [Zingiber officinale]